MSTTEHHRTQGIGVCRYVTIYIGIIMALAISSSCDLAAADGSRGSRIPAQHIVHTNASDGQSESISPGEPLVADQLASILMTDGAYDQLARLLATMMHQSMQEGRMPRIFRRALREDETRYFEALTESVKIAISRQQLEVAFALALQQQFNHDEMVQILSFMSTHVGQRYLALFSDTAFSDSVWGSIPAPHQTDMAAIMIGQFHRQFPAMGFDKRVPR